MSLYKDIHYDHHKILDLLYDIDGLGVKRTPLRKPLFAMLRNEILILVRAEDQTFYKSLKRSSKAMRLVKKLERQKQKIEQLLGKLDSTPFEQELWLSQFSALKVLVHHYISLEEKVLFPSAHKVLSSGTEARLARALKNAKEEQWETHVSVAPPSLKSQFFKTARLVA